MLEPLWILKSVDAGNCGFRGPCKPLKQCSGQLQRFSEAWRGHKQICTTSRESLWTRPWLCSGWVGRAQEWDRSKFGNLQYAVSDHWKTWGLRYSGVCLLITSLVQRYMSSHTSKTILHCSTNNIGLFLFPFLQNWAFSIIS